MSSEEIPYICKRCGNEYNWRNQEPPANGSIYWVASCPKCGAKMTATTVNQTWLEIIGSSARDISKLHAQARLYHGRMADTSVEELVRLAQHFDERVSSTGLRVGPQPSRNVAFALRKQARRKLKS